MGLAVDDPALRTSLLIRLVKYLQTFPNGSASLRMDSSEKLLEGMFPT